MQAFELPELFVELESLLQDPNADLNRIQAIKNLIVAEGPTAINNSIYLIKEIEGNVEALAKRIKELKARKDQKEATIERVREMIADMTDQFFSGKVKTTEFTVTMFDSHKVDIEAADLNMIPEAFVKREESLDRAKVKAALKDGFQIPGITVTERTERQMRII